MSNRYKNAVQIQQGACNPRPITKALLDAIDDARQEGKSEHNDPAVFLILHQLVWVLTGHDVDIAMDEGGQKYSDAMDACEKALATLEAEDAP